MDTLHKDLHACLCVGYVTHNLLHMHWSEKCFKQNLPEKN
jgi:hypothetical protein